MEDRRIVFFWEEELDDDDDDDDDDDGGDGLVFVRCWRNIFALRCSHTAWSGMGLLFPARKAYIHT